VERAYLFGASAPRSGEAGAKNPGKANVRARVSPSLEPLFTFSWQRTCTIACAMPKLLIIDDDASMRGTLRVRLKDSYDIFDSSSPEDALALALQHRPDAILLDLMMPRYSGFEVCQTLSSLSFTQHIPILIISGESSERYEAFCQNIGAKGFFEKPVDFDALEKALTELIASSRHSPPPDPRIRLKVMLTLRGIDSARKEFGLTTATENVGSTTFLCDCEALLDVGAIVNVFLARDGQPFAGKARVTRVDRPGTLEQRYDFQFIEKPSNWVLQ
jgi:CheY-like chemotaxis protein